MTRVKTTEARAALRAVLEEKARQAAGANTVISKAEARQLDPFLQKAEQEVRTAGSKGARVTVDAVLSRAEANANATWERFNPPGGTDGAFLAKAEVDQTAKADPARAERTRI